MKYHIETGLIFPPMDRADKVEDRIYVLLKTRVTTAYFWLSARVTELSNRCHSFREATSETSTDLLASSLGTGIEGYESVNTSEARPVGQPSQMVVEQKLYR